MSDSYTKEWMTEMRDRLNDVTKKCDIEMHEPDNQGVYAHVVGYKLDNAMGDRVIESAIIDKWQEFVVIINNGEKQECFNLACLIALARKAAI